MYVEGQHVKIRNGAAKDLIGTIVNIEGKSNSRGIIIYRVKLPKGTLAILGNTIVYYEDELEPVNSR